LADLQASIPQRVNEAVDERVNALMPTVVQSVVDYLTAGGKGPAPMINACGSNSFNVAPRGEGGGPEILVTPATNSEGDREGSPSVTRTTPAAVPSTRAELDALTVINRASQPSAPYLLHRRPL